MKMLRELRRVLSRSSFDSKAQTIKLALMPPFKALLVSLVGCGWEFYHEMKSPADCNPRFGWRMSMLFVPQLALAVTFVLQGVLLVRYNRRLHLLVSLLVLLMTPLVFVALIHSLFRLSINFCCCSPLFCPMTSPDQGPPDTMACSFIVSNCYWSLFRKATHFMSTFGVLPSLISLSLSCFATTTDARRAQQHISRFAEMTERWR
ncbi:hypothetical protein Poli38472_004429 [Pythium oligandrum]|uniref:Uncharacterized protein n=1 Tax=Pythium oligandrum TaxID=41045 RepID=A0A8K1CAQ2_PYTOL|nr:hypothetical protein Poli38472_004429 [Pythium oligandrum]|eukprot:TMW59360.1 hypothetical protein Poli38472_004429 [Pythium oligandrum]